MQNINSLPKQQSNYFGVPNKFFDEIMPRIKNMAALKCYLVLMRKTWGWQKKGDWLSLSQLMNLTKLSRPSVIDGMRWLKDNGFIWTIEVGETTKKKTMYYLCSEETEELQHMVESGMVRPKTVFELSTASKESLLDKLSASKEP